MLAVFHRRARHPQPADGGEPSTEVARPSQSDGPTPNDPPRRPPTSSAESRPARRSLSAAIEGRRLARLTLDSSRSYEQNPPNSVTKPTTKPRTRTSICSRAIRPNAAAQGPAAKLAPRQKVGGQKTPPKASHHDDIGCAAATKPRAIQRAVGIRALGWETQASLDQASADRRCHHDVARRHHSHGDGERPGLPPGARP
jgi:hypothetical protein